MFNEELQAIKVNRLPLDLKEKVEAFLADVECTTPYAEPLAITTTMTFEVSHEDAYDSDVDEAPHAAATFMANLTGTSTGEGTSNDTDFHSEAYRYWRDAPLSTVYPPTTSESSSRNFSSDLSTALSERLPHSFATHLPTPSPFVGPSQKRCRFPATLVPLATPTPGALSPTRADLLSPR
ncbi:hypothetical protein Tco_1046335 [Tanacetum coccineum]